MKTAHLCIGIAAFTIFPGGGLVHFLNQAIRALAQSRPDWQFTVIASIAMKKQLQTPAPNVKINFWDADPVSRSILQLASAALTPLGKAGDAGFLVQSRLERYHLPWGNINLLKELLTKQDTLWVPYYNIALDQLSLYQIIDPHSIPTLLTIHDVHPAFYVEDYTPDQIYRFYQHLGQFAGQCSSVITHSRFQRSAIQQTLAIQSDKIAVTPQPPLNNPNELLKSAAAADSAKLLASFNIQGRYAFYPASTLHTHKNHARLLVAWSQIKQQLGSECPKLVFTYQGNRAQAKRITDLVNGLQLQDQIYFTGLVNNQALTVLFQNCSLVVIPTLFEGAGSGILTDALTLGKPVACAKILPILEQLDTFAGAKVNLFDPFSVPDMASVIKQTWHNLDKLAPTTVLNQQIALQRFSVGWMEWAHFHTGLIQATLT